MGQPDGGKGVSIGNVYNRWVSLMVVLNEYVLVGCVDRKCLKQMGQPDSGISFNLV